MDSFTTSLGSPAGDGIRSESTPKSILKKNSKTGLKSKVLFSPTKEVKNFKDYFDSTDDEIMNDSIQLNLNRRRVSRRGSHEDITTAVLDKDDENLIHRILTDSNIPYVLSLYLQLLFNILIVGLIAYFVVIFITTIRSDINNKLELYITDSLQEISKCSREYYRNRCNDDKVPPVLENQCTSWLKCMNRDPQLIGKSRITAETLADILNGFVKPISWKAMFFLLIAIFGSLVITNVAFNTYRKSTNVKLDQLESTIKKQNHLIDVLKSESRSGNYLEPQDLSISSPLQNRNYS
ncbi:hypothetical protein PSN45_002947 [Yamadazyma tenuis]|uniref:Brl1/Brr6 domain-containing protein n=1 Tax=Candida tenuis (strain ATCC 10573 / BCRC 21748 / CBS 615 / JCM 9827 / NBRC 10315 / NRRL Y-1498 / VKM Y-70) TaxID=590646 RepID=G3AW50_CANTC|nr:uncharacterized protein CANTEDRAFT_112181 [Yamadazyma tenuis ATCC 10573]XP_006684026.1 uncharacterized protein CANTEDRAFT_112181 [Yamadazyma tenuis ATCC 10573]EGV66767.1 hypothetical protein CANTEDRAFT_112181 [Yamadazyma tenuis ATCC 10573]EGV66768.1 hypothetical protein CANTEDRAFT_112181 [Yamadazyma tenuis ATCC 10573]WEJ95428.1 hypothetical protein PSN45_002947 [Yamadazyma tenuis]